MADKKAWSHSNVWRAADYWGTGHYCYKMADEIEQNATELDTNIINTMATSQSITNRVCSDHNVPSDLVYPDYQTTGGRSCYDGSYSHDQAINSSCSGDIYQGLHQQGYEERGCWRQLYDYQSGHWYYQNLWTNATQWTTPVGWETWPVNNLNQPQQSPKDKTDTTETSCMSKFRKTSEELERKNTEYTKRPARRQVDPEEAKKLHWRPEGANEYNIWYDKWVGDHWRGTKDDGTISVAHCTTCL